MFTQCPSCSTVYEVNATDLSVGRGKVRCAFCESTFDALVRLSEDAPLHGTTLSGLPARERLMRQGERDTETGIAAADTQEPKAEPSVDAEGDATEPAAAEPAVLEAPAAETALSEAQAFESPERESPAPESTAAEAQQESGDARVEAQAELVELPTNEPEQAATSSAIIDAPGTSDAPATSTPPTTGEAQAACDEPATPAGPDSADEAADASALAAADSAAALDLELLPSTRGSASARVAWGIAATLMAMALLVQIVHRSRDQLLMRPGIAPYLQRIYGALGIELDPHWEVARYKVIRRPDLSTERSTDGEHSRLRLAATIMNGATRPQPYPLIRLTLEDRWGSVVAGRDFAPSEYLSDSARAAGMLAPGEHAPIDVVFIDPGADSVGFTIDICLADASGIVRCASDASGS